MIFIVRNFLLQIPKYVSTSKCALTSTNFVLKHILLLYLGIYFLEGMRYNRYFDVKEDVEASYDVKRFRGSFTKTDIFHSFFSVKVVNDFDRA